MELSKSSIVKVVLTASLTATVCMAAIVLMGWSLKSFWEFDANRKFQNAQLERLKDEVVEIEKAVESKRQDAVSVAEKWREYSELTNAIAKVSENVADHNRQLEELKKTKAGFDGEIAILQNAVSLTNSVLRSKGSELESIKAAIVDGERQKAELSGLEGAIAAKKQESENLNRVIEDQKRNREELERSNEKLQSLISSANTNLSAMVEQASGLKEIIQLRKEMIDSMDGEIKKLEERRMTLTKESDNLEKVIRIQSPKEKTLMNRLADLAGQYFEATNQLAITRAQLKQEIAQAQAGCDSEVQQKNKEAEDRIAKAKATLADAEVKAASIVSEAKAMAAEIEKTAKADKGEAEKARLEKSSAELAAAKAKNARIDDEEKSKAAIEKLAEITAQIKALEKIESADKEKCKNMKEELEKLREEVAALKETEERLTETIASRQKALQKLAGDNAK